MPDRFELVLATLAAALRQGPELGAESAAVGALGDELEEIAELRRLSAALAEPDSQSYTVS